MFFFFAVLDHCITEEGSQFINSCGIWACQTSHCSDTYPVNGIGSLNNVTLKDRKRTELILSKNLNQLRDHFSILSGDSPDRFYGAL